MERCIAYTIPAAYEQLPLQKYLMDKGYTSRILTCLRKDKNLVQINGCPSFLNTSVFTGDNIIIRIPESEEGSKIQPVNLPFEIIYEDEDFLVINKPAGMPVHPSLHNYDNSLANALACYYKDTSSPFVFRCISRLDRDTSGLTVIAKNMLSASILGTQTRKRQIEKTYFALAEGLLTPREGTINAPIARKEASCIERCVDFAHGEEAVTHYQVQQYYRLPMQQLPSSASRSLYRTTSPASSSGKQEQTSMEKTCTLVSIHLETGRTHQIRVHMKFIGHPLLGDFLYHPTDITMKRQALHAGALTLQHPVTGEKLHFEAPLPEDMQTVIRSGVPSPVIT